MHRILIVVLFCFLIRNFFAQNIYRSLNLNWIMYSQDSSQVFDSIKIPNEVHAVLVDKKVILHPFVNSNVDSIQHIGKKNWIFFKSFEITESELQAKEIYLQADHLDTYADLKLNGMPIGRTDNFFKNWSFSVKPYLRKGINHLQIQFYNPEDYYKKRALNSLPLPEGHRSGTRKPAYHYGWDWAPKLLTQGPQGNISLHVIKTSFLEDFNVETDSLSETVAYLNANLKIHRIQDQVHKLTLSVFENSEKRILDTILTIATQSQSICLTVKSPKLWWPSGMGPSHLYLFRLKLETGEQVVDTLVLTKGIRKIQWIQQPDSQGRSFYVKINEIPCFARGANIVPPHSIYSLATDSDYIQLVNRAQVLKMNMLRVWGGGYYMPESFYKQCDRKGILVWQDFMFANALYPQDNTFLTNVKTEIIQEVNRISKHTCLALWCGNNEITEAWNHWSWSKSMGYSATDSIQVWKSYQTLFYKEIPEILKLHPNKIFYHPTSPLYGWGDAKSYKFGDSHYWGVWWGQEPFSSYRSHVPRFASEFGFQSLPDKSIWKNWLSTPYQNQLNPILKSHQKHPNGFNWINRYLQQEFPLDTSLLKYTYLSQLLQRDGISEALKAQRFSNSYCMGSLIWQLNDCWPSISWSLIDFNQNNKALAYGLQSVWDLLGINAFIDSNKVFKLALHSWNSINTPLKLRVEWKNFNGRTIYNYQQQLQLNTNNKFDLILNLPSNSQDKTESYIKVSVYNLDKEYHQFVYFVPANQLKLKPSKIKIEKINSNTLQISTNQFSKDVFLYDSNHSLTLDNNFITLEPGKPCKIKFTSKDKFKTNTVKWLSLNSILHTSNQ